MRLPVAIPRDLGDLSRMCCRYYIQAEEVLWQYGDDWVNNCTGLNYTNGAEMYMQQVGSNLLASVCSKVLLILTNTGKTETYLNMRLTAEREKERAASTYEFDIHLRICSLFLHMIESY